MVKARLAMGEEGERESLAAMYARGKGRSRDRDEREERKSARSTLNSEQRERERERESERVTWTRAGAWRVSG